MCESYETWCTFLLESRRGPRATLSTGLAGLAGERMPYCANPEVYETRRA